MELPQKQKRFSFRIVVPYRVTLYVVSLLLAVNITSAQETLVSPDKMTLNANSRYEVLNTDVGKIYLRWPRSVEKIFGRTPRRAVADAAQSVKRVLSRGFPPELIESGRTWQVIFLDENLPEKEIPSYLVSSCHPGWMTPPANIYIVAQRVIGKCGGNQGPSWINADSALAETMIHEMGHAVESAWLGDAFGGDRMRAEGFATWFQTYAAKYSDVINEREMKERLFASAAQSYKASPNIFLFSGSAGDYARASLYFHAIVERRGIAGLADIYELMGSNKLSLPQAVQQKIHWNSVKLEEEAMKVIDMKPLKK